MFNKVILIGRLGRDPELRASTSSGAPFCNFSIASTHKYGDEEDTFWGECVVFGKQAENAAKYLKKGSLALVEGRLTTRSWEKDGVKRSKTEIIVQNVRYLDNKRVDDDTDNEPF